MTPREINASNAIIVGGTAGIGLASAEALLTVGLPRLVLVGRSRERGQAVCDGLRSRFPAADIHFMACDATDADDLSATVDSAATCMDGIDILVSCAGGDPMPRLLHAIPLGDIMPTINMIAGGVILPARAVLPHMTARGGGVVICVASDAAKVATPGETVIGAAMAAITMFCRGMAWEAKRHGIRVNCLTPSVVGDTPLYGRLKEDDFARKLFAKAETMANLGIVTAADLAAAIVFLASPAAAKMTGQTISITGGISAV